MQTILISVISDQTIPNLLIIKEFEGQYPGQVFISTLKMESDGKSRWIELAAGLEPNSVSRVVVDENSWHDIKNKLQKYTWPENSRFLVNLTGGTKVMTLAVYEFFARPGNRIVYAPIGKNQFEELFPNRDLVPEKMFYRLNVSEYLSAYGISFIKKETPLKSLGELKTIFNSFKNKGYEINSLNDGYPPEWRNYFTGVWFEEYLFYQIKNELKLNEGFIELGVELMHFNETRTGGNDQELDIVFTLENELYLVEAKVSLGKPPVKKEAIHQIIFKLSAINKNFGLRSHASVITLADVNDRSENFRRDLERKMKVLGIKAIIDRNRLAETNFSFRDLVL